MYQISDPKTGILYRDGTFDQWIINESKGYFPLDLKEDDIVLDVGGHIGAFAARVKLENHKVKVTSFEAEKSNYEVLCENALKFGFAAQHYAVVNDASHLKEIPLFVNTLKNNALHSLLPTKGRPTQKVTGFSFNKILFRYEPTIVKIDIEGGEFLLPLESIASWPQVRLLIIEYHLSRKGFREKAKEKDLMFKDMGFKAVKEPKIGPKNWTTLGRYER